MGNHIATRLGDVLILKTEGDYTVFAVGRVRYDGQLDLHAAPNTQHARDEATAFAMIRPLLEPGKRIILRNLDTGVWSEITR